MENGSAKLLSNLINKSFKYLMEEYDFQLAQDHSSKFRASTANCHVLMEFEKGHFFCWIENHTKGPQKIHYKGLNVRLISICRGYLPPNDPVFFSSSERLINEIDEYSLLLRKYCSDFLNGDFRDWSLVEYWVQQQENERKDLMKNFHSTSRQQFYKEKADQAWVSKDYKGVVDCYMKIFENLTPLERKRLEYAKIHINK
jgi:hypothetical protein